MSRGLDLTVIPSNGLTPEHYAGAESSAANTAEYGVRLDLSG